MAIFWVSHTELIAESGVSRNTFNDNFLEWIFEHYPPQRTKGNRKKWTRETADKIISAIANGEIEMTA